MAWLSDFYLREETIKDGCANFYLQQRSQASNIVPQQMFIERSQIHGGPENVY
jgi:hypothetical protein